MRAENNMEADDCLIYGPSEILSRECVCGFLFIILYTRQFWFLRCEYRVPKLVLILSKLFMPFVSLPPFFVPFCFPFPSAF